MMDMHSTIMKLTSQHLFVTIFRTLYEYVIVATREVLLELLYIIHNNDNNISITISINLVFLLLQLPCDAAGAGPAGAGCGAVRGRRAGPRGPLTILNDNNNHHDTNNDIHYQ